MMFYNLIHEKTLLLHVRLTPKAGHNKIKGIFTASDGKTYLSVSVKAQPEKGEANKALIKFLAQAFSLPANLIHLQRGGTSRLKMIRIEEAPAGLIKQMQEWLPGKGATL